MKPNFKYLNKPALEPVPGCDWASKMVLNPAIVQDPESSTLHMLFRATGPWAQKRREGCHDPYPIFLGYATSEDNGETWEADFSEPALSPALGYEEHELYIADIHGNRVRNYANGCMEDPRIFPIEGSYTLVWLVVHFLRALIGCRMSRRDLNMYQSGYSMEVKLKTPLLKQRAPMILSRFYIN